MVDTQSETPFRLEQGSWQTYQSALTAVRYAVFVDEQGVPAALELDKHDNACLHVLATDPTGRPIGSGRIMPDGHIGRMAVLQDCRGQGVGRAILSALLDYAQTQGHATVFLHAQLRAVEFYQKAGFTLTGEPFEDAGIVHRRMQRTLP